MSDIYPSTGSPDKGVYISFRPAHFVFFIFLSCNLSQIVYNESKGNEKFLLEKEMTMRSKSTETMKRILDCVNRYYLEHYQSPSMAEIAACVGIAKGTVYKYIVEMNENGMLSYANKVITTNIMEKTAPKLNRAAVLGSVSCGVPLLAEENIEEYVSLPASLFGDGEFFILRGHGESMIEAGIGDGDLVVIRQQNSAENGEIVVALMDEEATLKRFYKEEDQIRLHPENSEMEDILVSDCRIQGVAVNVIKKLN